MLLSDDVAEAARIGQTTDYDKLTIEVWTNGAVTPRDAVSLAAKLVRDHFTIFVGLNEVGDQVLGPGAEQARSMNALGNSLNGCSQTP